MKKIILTLIAVVLAIGVSPLAQASTSITKLVVSAKGVDEKPNNGAIHGSASGTFTLNTTKNAICFTNMKTKGLANVIAAHIHLGATGIDGSVFVTVVISNFNRVGQTCMKVAHRVLVDIANHPTDYYFNVHTKDFPGGAVRGQLKKSS
jgi:hypothetical protein